MNKEEETIRKYIVKYKASDSLNEWMYYKYFFIDKQNRNNRIQYSPEAEESNKINFEEG